MVGINYDLVDNKAKSKNHYHDIAPPPPPPPTAPAPHQEDGGNNIFLGSWGNLQVGSL